MAFKEAETCQHKGRRGCVYAGFCKQADVISSETRNAKRGVLGAGQSAKNHARRTTCTHLDAIAAKKAAEALP